MMQPTRDESSAQPRALNILARSLFRQMREQGYSSEQIVGLSSELLALVSSDLRASQGRAGLEAAE